MRHITCPSLSRASNSTLVSFHFESLSCNTWPNKATAGEATLWRHHLALEAFRSRRLAVAFIPINDSRTRHGLFSGDLF